MPHLLVLPVRAVRPSAMILEDLETLLAGGRPARLVNPEVLAQ